MDYLSRKEEELLYPSPSIGFLKPCKKLSFQCCIKFGNSHELSFISLNNFSTAPLEIVYSDI